MATPIDAQLILCDAAQADPSGKIHMLGAGWSTTSSPTAPHSVAVLIKVPWDLTNQKLPLHLELVTADGQPVTVPTALGAQKVNISSELEVGRPPGVEHGSYIDATLALNVPSLPLPAGRYQYRLQILDDHFTASFKVRAYVA